MKIIALLAGGLMGLFLLFAIASNFSFYIHPLFSACTDLSVGMTHDEILERMHAFEGNSSYRIIEDDEGNYGWKNRLHYDGSLLFLLEKEPWYKLDQHPWRCEIFLKDGLAVNITAQFD